MCICRVRMMETSNSLNHLNFTVVTVLRQAVALFCCVYESVSETSFPLLYVRLKAVVLLCHGSELEKLDPAVFQKQLHSLKFR